jgi:O-antigen/teichoic acid export membrane protein
LALPSEFPAPPDAPSTRHLVPVRFAAALTSNAFGLGLSFFASIFVARGLGPGRYGDLSFLIASFAAVATLLDMGSSSAFYTFLSRRRRGWPFFRRYAGWLALQLGIVLAALCILPPSWLGGIWLGQPRMLLLAAAVAGFVANQFWRCVQQIGESARETIMVQVAGAGINTLHAVLMGFLFLRGRLTVVFVLTAISAEYALIGVLFACLFPWSRVCDKEHVEPEFRKSLSDYARYCRPLVIAGWAGFTYSFADRWLLQRFSGSIQQGFFSLGQQFATVSLLAAASFINILWKEVAQAHERGDIDAAGRLFLRSGRLLYFVAAALACFGIPFSRDVLTRLVGEAYAGGWLTFAVLALFPLHQTLGQINGTFFHATGRTRLVMLFTLLSAASSVIFGYLVLAPGSSAVPGLGLQSIGLAVKMVLLQAALVNLQGYVICRSEGWRWPFAYQLGIPCALLALSLLCRAAVSWFPTEGSNLWLFAKLGIGGVLYGAVLAAAVIRHPGAIGADAADIRRWLELGRHSLRAYFPKHKTSLT